jgi:hypothetical protein
LAAITLASASAHPKAWATMASLLIAPPPDTVQPLGLGPNSEVRLGSTPLAVKPRLEVADGEASERIAPVSRDFAQRIKHEAARAELTVRNAKPRPGPDAAAPQDDIKIKHPRPPAPAPRTPAKGALYGLELGEQGRGRQVAVDQRGGIGIGALARANRAGMMCARESQQLRIKRRDCGLDDALRPAETAMRTVRTKGDKIAQAVA